MKRSEYNDFMDQIKCSGQFTEKMEELLNSEFSEYHEYADNIAGVERASKRRIIRYAGGAAACLVLAGAVGAGYKLIAGNDLNTPEEYYSGVTDITNETSQSETIPDIQPATVLPDTFDVDYIESFEISEFEAGWLDDVQKKQLSATLISILWEYTPEINSFPDGGGAEFLSFEFFSDGVLHFQLIIREDHLAKYTVYGESGDVTEHFYKVSDMYDQLSQIVDAGDPYKLIESGDYESAVYFHDASQTAESMEFDLTDGEALKENLLMYEWEPVSYEEFKYERFYILSEFMINEDGYIHSNATERCYKMKGDVSDKIAKTLQRDLMMDDITYLKYMLSLSEKDYNTMTADVEASFNAERYEVSGGSESYASYPMVLSGKLYDDRQSDSMYITAEGTAGNENSMPVTARSISLDTGEWYIESGEDIGKLNNVRSFYDSDTAYEYFEESDIFGIEASELNYSMLDKRVLRDLSEIMSVWQENGLADYAVDTDFYTCIKNDDGSREYYISNETIYSCIAPTRELYVKIDSKGNIIGYEKQKDYEKVCSYTFSNIVYDAEGFEMPVLSEEELAIVNSQE